jgi:hypothetical protein
MLPVVLAVANQVARSPSFGTAAALSAPKASSKAPKAKTFSISMNNLNNWASTVVVDLTGVTVEGRSPMVHALADDCEMHLGAHATSFVGNPNGLVLEPMNACTMAFPGKSEQNDADWLAWGDSLVKLGQAGTTVVAMGVPRIWPEHLTGAGSDSNPNHAAELHPLTGVVASGVGTTDFSSFVSAGEYRGGVGQTTALAIVQNTSVSVTRTGQTAEIAFRSGTIGNFTVLELLIDPASIKGDGAGSFRMDADVVVDSSTAVPVRVVSAKGSPINSKMRTLASGTQPIDMMALVLYSLSPQALLDAANSSRGNSVGSVRPIQLILYGEIEEE